MSPLIRVLGSHWPGENVSDVDHTCLTFKEARVGWLHGLKPSVFPLTVENLPSFARLGRARRPSPHVLTLLQLGVLGFGFFQDGDVGIGVFPQREEILIGGSGFRRVSGHPIGAGLTELG
jgi:hypothetical protein